MINIEFSEAEAARLEEVLAEYLSDLRMEIADTDNMDYREKLKDKENFLNSIMRKLAKKV